MIGKLVVLEGTDGVSSMTKKSLERGMTCDDP